MLLHRSLMSRCLGIVSFMIGLSFSAREKAKFVRTAAVQTVENCFLRLRANLLRQEVTAVQG